MSFLLAETSIFLPSFPTQAAFDFSAGRRTTRHGVLRASGESVTSHGMCVVLICRNIHFFYRRSDSGGVRFLRRTAYNKARRAAGSQLRHLEHLHSSCIGGTSKVCRTHHRSFSVASAAPAAGDLHPHSGRDDRCGNILLGSSASASAAASVAFFICRKRFCVARQ